MLPVVNEFDCNLLPGKHISDIGAKMAPCITPVLPMKNFPGLGDCQFTLIRRRACNDYIVTVVKSGIPKYFIAHIHFLSWLTPDSTTGGSYSDPEVLQLNFEELGGEGSRRDLSWKGIYF